MSHVIEDHFSHLNVTARRHRWQASRLRLCQHTRQVLARQVGLRPKLPAILSRSYEVQLKKQIVSKFIMIWLKINEDLVKMNFK